MKVKCPKGEKSTMKSLPAKTKGRSYQMTLSEAKEETDVASSTFLVINCLPRFYLIQEQITHLFHKNLEENLNYHHID